MVRPYDNGAHAAYNLGSQYGGNAGLFRDGLHAGNVGKAYAQDNREGRHPDGNRSLLPMGKSCSRVARQIQPGKPESAKPGLPCQCLLRRK